MQDLMSSLTSFARFTVFTLVHNFSHFCSNSIDFSSLALILAYLDVMRHQKLFQVYTPVFV